MFEITPKVREAIQAMTVPELQRRLDQVDQLKTDAAMRQEARLHMGRSGEVRGIVSTPRLDAATELLKTALREELDSRG